MAALFIFGLEVARHWTFAVVSSCAVSVQVKSGGTMGLNESDTRAKLIDPTLHSRGWTEDLIRREETAGTIQIIEGQPRKSARGRVDYALRIKVTSDSQPVAVRCP